MAPKEYTLKALNPLFGVESVRKLAQSAALSWHPEILT